MSSIVAPNKLMLPSILFALNFILFSEDLFLNLGNAYFQESNFGQARWSYEMGLKLNPMNTDLQNNSNIYKIYIEGFIDDNSDLWGRTINDIPISSVSSGLSEEVSVSTDITVCSFKILIHFSRKETCYCGSLTP